MKHSKKINWKKARKAMKERWAKCNGKGWPKIEGMNRHHWLNKCHGGKFTKANISYLDIERHDAWHAMFKNMNLDEAIALMIRVRDIKNSQKKSA